MLDAFRGRHGPEGALAAANAVLERLRSVMTPLIGEQGYAALIGRSLALAQPGGGCLEAGRSPEGGTLSLASAAPGAQPPELAQVCDAAVAVVGSLISLLLTFIGDALTRRALQRGWPDLDLTTHDASDDHEETSDE